MGGKGPKVRVQSLSRGLKLLETVVKAGRQVSNAELDDVLPIERSSIFRLLQTLVDEGYLSQDRQTKQYEAGPKILELANHLTQSMQLLRVCHPYIEELTELSGETSHCAVLNGTQVVFVDHVLSPHAVGVTIRAGRMEPIYCTALGKALVVDLSEADLEELFNAIELKAYTSNTIVSFHAFLEEMKHVRGEGIAVDDEEYAPGLRCVAAPIWDFSRKCIGSIGISGPTVRLDDKAMAAAQGYVRGVAERLCRNLGYISR